LQSSSSRILRVVTYWTAVVILAGYSASFVSYLTVRHPAIPFSTFPELLEKDNYRLGVLPDSSLMPFFQVGVTCCSVCRGTLRFLSWTNVSNSKWTSEQVGVAATLCIYPVQISAGLWTASFKDFPGFPQFLQVNVTAVSFQVLTFSHVIIIFPAPSTLCITGLCCRNSALKTSLNN